MKYKGNILWTVVRTLTFWWVGLMNTLFIHPENVGEWQNYIGYGFLLLALLDSIGLILHMIQKSRG